MASNKEMLSALIRLGKLTHQEREAFESMWDQVHRTAGKLSNKQRSWVEKVYFAQKLDQPKTLTPREPRSPKVGFAYDEAIKRTVAAFNITQFETICPTVAKDSPFYGRVKKFFESGGERFELRAGKKPETPTK